MLGIVLDPSYKIDQDFLKIDQDFWNCFEREPSYNRRNMLKNIEAALSKKKKTVCLGCNSSYSKSRLIGHLC